MYKDFKWLTIFSRYCRQHECADCDINRLLEYPSRECVSQIEKHFYEVCNILIKFNEEHLFKTNKDVFLNVFPDAVEIEELDPCTFSKVYADKNCDNYTNCCDCRKEFWDSVYIEVKDE